MLEGRMGLIERIKSALGLGTSTSTSPSQASPSTADGPSPGETTAGDASAADEGDEDREDEQDDGVDVTVEHEPSTETEDAVKGTDTADEPASDADLEEIKGIGSTYAERLREAGVADVGELAAADPADLAERADVPAGRLEDWIEQAQSR